jgi:light-harvesting complex 1 beta chain
VQKQRGGEQTVASKEPSDADLVPGQWKLLFSNEDWLIHGIIVYTTYGFLAIAIVAHILVYLWRPWLP